MNNEVRKPLSTDRQEAIIEKACKLANLGSHIKRITSRKDAATWAEKIAVQHQRRKIMPVKSSYMYCDTLDMCFYFLHGHTPAIAYAGYAVVFSKDASGGLAHAFAKANEVLRYMAELMNMEEHMENDDA